MKKAFTLVELLIVMVLMAIITGIAIPAMIGMSQGAAMRGTLRSLSATLSLCRQWAITHREPITFNFRESSPTNLAYYYVISGSGVLINDNTEISGDVTLVVDNGESDAITFTPAGQLRVESGDLNVTADGNKYINVVDRKSIARGNEVVKTITINWLTGGIQVN